jgi:hypothetical protein
MREAITVIEIICSKPMMHLDTCLKIFEHKLDIFQTEQEKSDTHTHMHVHTHKVLIYCSLPSELIS